MPPSPSATDKSHSRPLRVFVAGHSFHIFVSTGLEDLVRRAGIKKYSTVGLSAIGGSTVLRHWDFRPAPAPAAPASTPSPEPDSNPLKDALAAGQVDVLTLSPIWLPDEGIENFARFALAHNPDIRITVQEFWMPNDEYVPIYPLDVKKLVDHDAVNLLALRDAQERYQNDLHDYISDINRRLGKQVLFTVAVGPAVLALREKIAAGLAVDFGKQSDLFSDSWGHPNSAIKQVVAYCHFAVIFRDPLSRVMPAPAIQS
jgi:hypothetical protein